MQERNRIHELKSHNNGAAFDIFNETTVNVLNAEWVITGYSDKMNRKTYMTKCFGFHSLQQLEPPYNLCSALHTAKCKHSFREREKRESEDYFFNFFSYFLEKVIIISVLIPLPYKIIFSSSVI
ncbi:hypothetical protein L2E82_23042 [Cichorium intybus]|uniref:Uncharacterized protein n=1 Tax=Cichorium intybus TaxID=13427 RepID=A0ACB9DZU3_CICIN|nr:hypothetical protein L2E82_23042 [Cichorium intybus]